GTRGKEWTGACRRWPIRLAAARSFCARSTIASARTCLPAAACTAMTPRYRCWPKARRRAGGRGSMFGTIARSGVMIRRQPCSSTRATELAITPSAISKDFNRLYEAGRKPGPITEAACWAHGRRNFFALADITANVRGKLSVVAPLALAAIKRIDAIFDIEREISGLSADERLTVRRGQVASLVADLEAWMRTERAKLSRHSEVAKAMDYM